jgi:ribonuclease HI
MRHLVYLYADESCLGVQFTDRDSPGGAAGLVEYWRGQSWVRRDYWVSEPATTNNRMALRSGIEGLMLLRQPCRVVFTSDSQYLVRGMREWVHGWVRRGWRRKDGPVENEDLWKQLVATAARHAIDWRWVRGHAGHAQNEYANELATRAAREQNHSRGLVASGFASWLAQQREQFKRYVDFQEGAAPRDERFDPVRAVES